MTGPTSSSASRSARAPWSTSPTDAYGQTVDSDQPGSVASGYFRYQGRLDISPTGTALYDMSARFYAPGLGTFTGLDSYGGSVADPASMNRFLYAQGNPATLIDPTGHCEDCSAIILANQQKARAKEKSQSSTTSTTSGASNTTAPTATTAPHVNSSVSNPCADSARCGPHTPAFAGAQATASGCNPVLSVSACRGQTYIDAEDYAPLGVVDAGWRVTGGFVLEGIESAAFLAQHLDKVPDALGLTARQAGDAAAGLAAGAGDVATHLDQLPDRVAGLAHDMNRSFFAGVDAFERMSPRQQVDFATSVGIAAVGAEQAIVTAPRTIAGLRGLGKGKPSSAGLSFSDTQLQSQMAQHGADFGASGSPGSPIGRIEYMSNLVDHVDAPGTTRIPGTYRGEPAIHYVDPEYGLNVFTTPEGGFWGAWRLGPEQIENVILRGSLR